MMFCEMATAWHEDTPRASTIFSMFRTAILDNSSIQCLNLDGNVMDGFAMTTLYKKLNKR
jgi:hypothetical protein